MSAALVCIAKMEHPYIEEFVRYYLCLGFDAIYIYENDEVPQYASLFQSEPRVHVLHFPGHGTPTRSVQLEVLDHFCATYKDLYRWIAHFDCDEFLVLKKHRTIQEFCQEHCREGGVGICWIHFGDNGHTKFEPLPVTARFTRRESETKLKTTYVKCIICSSAIFKYSDFHMPMLKQGTIRTTRGDLLTARETSTPVWDVAQLNHYFCKTFEEFQRRKIRGQAGVPSTHPNKHGQGKAGRYDPHMFEAFNKNEVEDLWAKEFYERCLLQVQAQTTEPRSLSPA